MLYRDSNYENRDYSAWPHPIGSHVFYYDENNQVRCVDLEGNNLNVQEAHKVLLAYNDALPAAEKAAMTGWHRSSLGSTGAIILGDRYYQSSLYEMLSYFKNVYGRDSSSEIKYPKSNQFLGFDHFHNGYWVSLNSNTEEMLYVFSRQGELIFQKNYVPDVKLPVYPNVIRLHLARESGNIYAMQTDAKEGTIVYKMNHAWGRPNMLAIAINGMGGDTAYDEYVKKTLSVFSKAELRLQRNHLFALYGYVFNSADLKAYFETQNWYEPDPSVTSSVDYLTDAQKQLFEFIRELETGM
ncbi:MAG: YARHG domain-containing protein [Tannerellaceae bacterium]|nr:YARHG domain-containing protein [Tannerellaceae bacterium]